MSPVGRLLGLDPGGSRIGVAVSDELGWTAQPYGVVDRIQGQELEKLKEICMEVGASGIVIGLPRRTGGQEGPEAEQVRVWAQQLSESTGLPIHFWDERFTTAEAERLLISGGVSRKERRGRRDMLAATLILQVYLDRARRK